MDPSVIPSIIQKHITTINHPNIYVNFNKLDKGSSGRIYLVKGGNNKYVCKITSVDYKGEADIMSKLDHPNIVKFYGSHISDFTYLFMEYIEGYSLYDWLSKKNLTTNTARIIISKVVNGVKYLHDKNIYHRDIKMENIMINPSTSCVKLIDFGFSIEWTSDMELLTKYCGSVHYAAPEILCATPYKGGPSDIWSLGILIFTVFSAGVYPFDNNEDDYDDLKSQICNEEPNYNKIKHKSIIPLIKEMIKKDPNERCNIDYIHNNLCPGQSLQQNTLT